ncbi:MAG: hypothetical protein AB7S78_11930 [Candidatus Omnitrophota bacterium]
MEMITLVNKIVLAYNDLNRIKNKESMNRSILKYYIALNILTFYLLLSGLALYMKLPEKHLFGFLTETSFKPHQNIMLYGQLNHIPFPIFLYVAIFVLTIILWVFNRVIHSANPNNYPLDCVRTFFLISTLSVFTFLLIIQTICISKVWGKSFELFANKTEVEKFHGSTVQQSLIMAEFCKKFAPGTQKAKFETDLDITEDPGMLIHRSFAFYLYPIDIRNIYRGEPNLWIAFQKKEAIRHVPRGYKVLGILDDQNIIAMKE